MSATYDAGQETGKTLAAVAMRRHLVDGDVEFDIAGLIEYLLGVPGFAVTPDQRARQAIFVALCRELERYAEWGFQREAFKFNFEDEQAAMKRAVRRATSAGEKWKRFRASLAA